MQIRDKGKNMNIDTKKKYMLKVAAFLGFLTYAIFFVFNFKTNPDIINNWYSAMLFIAALIANIQLILELPTSNPWAKYTPEELHQFEINSPFFVPKNVAKRLFEEQGVIYQWQVEEQSINKDKAAAKKHFGLSV